MMANFQSGAFYLPNVLLLLLPFFSAIRAIFLFHYLVAAIGAFVLCRRWRYPSYLAVVGALLFTLGGTIVSLSNLLNHFQAAVWLPWVLFFWERCLERQSWKNITVLTLVVLLQFLAGSPELYAMTMALVLLDGARWRVACFQTKLFQGIVSLADGEHTDDRSCHGSGSANLGTLAGIPPGEILPSVSACSKLVTPPVATAQPVLPR